MSNCNAGVGVETLSWQGSINLASITDVQDSRERVGEIQDQEGADEAGDAVEIGDGRSYDEGDDPVDRAEGVPKELSLLGGDFGPVEDFLANFDIDSLHADVEVEQACNKGSDEAEHIIDLL